MVQSQTVFSPYSNYGIGNISTTKNATLRAMGNSGYGFRDHTVINSTNPASYTEFDTLSFVFEGGAEFNSLKLSSSTGSETGYYTGLGYLQFGFPIWKYIKASVGITPMSNVGYNVITQVSDEITGNKEFRYQAQGGINDFYGGIAFQVWNFSIGANASYLFGTIDKAQVLAYPDSSNFLSIKLLDKSMVSAFSVNTGLQYYQKIADKMFLCVGVTYRPKMNLNTSTEYISYTFTESSSGTETIKDTISIASADKAPIVLPQKIGAGVMLKKLNRYKIQANFDWTEWSEYSTAIYPKGTMANAYNASLGFEYSPRTASVSSYWKWVKYRLGAYYGQTGIVIDDVNINQFGMTFGLSLPITRSLSSINVTMDIGNRGTVSNDLIQETCFNITVGFSLYDNWFYRIKYR